MSARLVAENLYVMGMMICVFLISYKFEHLSICNT